MSARLLVVIAHAAWDERRKAPLERLMGELRAQGVDPFVYESPEREHASRWATRMWRGIAFGFGIPDPPDTPVLILNDDVSVHSELVAHATALAEGRPGRVIGFHPNFPEIVRFVRLKSPGYRLVPCYWPSGPGMLMTAATCGELVEWLETTPAGWFGGDVNEDGAIAAFLWRRQTPALLTIPALVRHDTSIPSTLGYDAHAGRTSPVDWEVFQPCAPSVWSADDVDDVPLLAVPWRTEAQFAQMDQVLSGQRPLCGFCLGEPGLYVHPKRGTGICAGCARGIVRGMGIPVPPG